MMGWTVEQFWHSLPCDFQLAITAFDRVQERTMDNLAWLASNIMSIQVAKKDRHTCTPGALRGKKSKRKVFGPGSSRADMDAASKTAADKKAARELEEGVRPSLRF